MRTPREDSADRRQEIVNACLDEFLKTGLFETSARDLGRALHMHPGGLYYYFENKDAIVVACAEEAAIRLEDALILPMLNELDDPDGLAAEARNRLEELAPTMRFFAQVCTTWHYKAAMVPILARMKQRHLRYAEQFAERLHCATEEVAPYLYACVATVANYMIFGEELYFDQPTLLLRQTFQRLKAEKQVRPRHADKED